VEGWLEKWGRSEERESCTSTAGSNLGASMIEYYPPGYNICMELWKVIGCHFTHDMKSLPLRLPSQLLERSSTLLKRAERWMESHLERVVRGQGEAKMLCLICLHIAVCTE